jgi:hypothetical protein
VDLATKISIWALVVSILTGIFGAMGGVPGIKAVFFSKPKLTIEGFMPIVVYDEGNSRDTKYPKFNLKGVLRVTNPNGFDVNLNEIKLYGRTQDSSGKYHYQGKPLYYELNVAGVFDTGSTIVKAYSSKLVKCNFARFENDQEPGVMHGQLGLKAGYSKEVDSLLFHIFLPSYNQLFKYNDHRVPFELVPEAYDGHLSFALVFNNELINIAPNRITKLVSSSKEEWENGEHIAKLYNATVNLYK